MAGQDMTLYLGESGLGFDIDHLCRAMRIHLPVGGQQSVLLWAFVTNLPLAVSCSDKD